MRITAPNFVCPLLRPFRVRGENRLGVSVASGWTLAGAPLPVQELWTRFTRAAGPEAVLDAGIPKSASEWLLVGTAHAAQPVTELVVGVETLGTHKALSVVGDRVWRRGVPTEPTPFLSMPLGWERAFGGVDCPSNPLGRGYTNGDPEGVPLPNVELYGRMIDSPSARPEPAGMGPFGAGWPVRLEGLGTYDRKWFSEDFPGFADDIDWRVHNAAPLDQRWDSAVCPEQEFVLHHLVQGCPRVVVRLPPVVGRCFVYGPTEDERVPRLTEIALVPRTVWLVPDEDMVVVVSSGSHLVHSELLSDVAGIVLGLDAVARPRGIEHWEAAAAARLEHSRDGLLAMLDDAPFMPDGMEIPSYESQAEDFSLPDRSGVMERNLHAGALKRREDALAAFAAAGFEDGESLFPAPPPPNQPSDKSLREQIREAESRAKEERERAEAQLAEFKRNARVEMERAGLDASFLDEKEPAGGPPPVLAQDRIAHLQTVVDECRSEGMSAEVLEAQLNDPAWHRELIVQERQGREGYRLVAHRIESMPEPLSDDRKRALREQVERAIRDRSSLSEQDLTGADLNELDLSGMDLRGAWLEGAELAKANLTEALLERAVLAKADLCEATLHRTVLRRANLGRARLLFTDLRDCDLVEAILAHANLRAASFAGCNLQGVDLSEARFEQTTFRRSNLEGASLIQMSLSGVEFDESRLANASLIEVRLDGVSFHRCDLSKAALVTCKGTGVRFDEANLENARFVADCELEGADFRGANVGRATLRGCALEGADFDGADLRNADLSQANCTRARFVKADMRKLLATECELEEAVLRGANLMEAVLQGSDLRGADLTQTNLFGADLALIRGDGRTTLAGALTTRMRIRPLRKGEPVEGGSDGG